MNEAKIHNLFPVPVFHYKLENYQETNQELLNYILELQKKDKIGNSGGLLAEKTYLDDNFMLIRNFNKYLLYKVPEEFVKQLSTKI